MKITQLEILPAPYQGRAYIYVKLHTDEGIIGIGEASCSGKEGALMGALRDVEHVLIGEDPFQVEEALADDLSQRFLARRSGAHWCIVRHRARALGY